MGEDTLSVAFSSKNRFLCTYIKKRKFFLKKKKFLNIGWGKEKKETTIEMILNPPAGLPALRTKVKDGGFLIGIIW
ncbi:hypothetical protein CM15mP35_08600 [bacterium]|nr:MAG: hypothetical protein CM15mP35_08600 [bacterium]